MERELVIQRLEQLPMEIERAEKNLIDAVMAQTAAVDALKEKESSLQLSGLIDGKNAEIRQAQLAEKTKPERDAVKTAEAEVSEAKMVYNYKLNEFKAARAIAGLLQESGVA